MEWADVVKQFHHDDRLAWADVIDEEEAQAAPASTWAEVVVAPLSRGAQCAARAASPPSEPATSAQAAPASPPSEPVTSAQAAPASTWAEVVVAPLSRGARCAARAASPPSEPVTSAKAAPSEDPGTPVGIRAVQTILMSATQMNLSHFHTAGMNTIASIAPSAADAINMTYTHTGMTFQCPDDVYSARMHIVGATLSSFVTTVGSSVSGFSDAENVWYDAAGSKMYSGTVLRFYIDYNKMRNHGLTLSDLATGAFGDANVSVSPDFMGMIDVEVPDDYMSQWLSRTSMLVCGTPKISSCDKTSDIQVVTRGTDVLAVSRLANVNKRTITSNHVPEVETHFGIEAASSVLKELTGSRIVSDFMARTGQILPFVKSSVEVRRKGVLTSMGFERPKDDIKNMATAITGSSVYESIVTGKNPAGCFDVRV